MPVYRTHELVHIHVPKTGGTAIEEYFHSLGDLEWGLESWVGQARHRGRWYEFQHVTLAELRALAEGAYDDFESFAVVRHPYDRLMSEYRWRRLMSATHPNSTTKGFDSVDAFLTAIPDDIDDQWNAHAAEADQATTNFLIHVRPQHHYVCDADGRIAVDHVLRFEHLRDDIEPILRRRGLDTGPFRNHDRPPELPDDIDPAHVDRIDRIYARDFDLLPYSAS